MMIVRRRCVGKLSSFLVKNYGTSVPVLPPVSNEIIPLIPFKTMKRKGRKAGGSFPSSSGAGFPLIGPTSTGPATGFNVKLAVEEFVDLFSVYGNILTKEGGELVQKYNGNVKEFSSYPLDPNLLCLFENSVKFWYAAENVNEMKFPVLMSINAPSRSSTWELAKYLVGRSGKSHLAVIPMTMFHELLQTCLGRSGTSKRVEAQEAKALGDFILDNITNGFKSNNKKALSPFKMNLPSGVTSNSRAVIQVVEYLFACLEASVPEGEHCTLILDGMEEFLLTRKGGDVILKDLSNWSNLFNCTGRKIVLGGRNSQFEVAACEEETNENNPEDDDAPSNSNNSIISLGSGKPPGNAGNTGNNQPNSSPLQVIADFLFKSTGTKMGGSEPVASNTNVRIEGPILRLLVSGPKTDKRKLLKYSQILGIDRKRDIFDANMSLLRSIALNRWNLPLALDLKSKYDLPSIHPEIWGKLSESGKGILTKRKLDRDDLNEVIMYVLGSANRNLTVESLDEALERVSQIRHDPTRFSSDDLNHLLAERQLSLNSLTKYEKRFINCISTATTQTHFADISLPNGTVKTLKSLTSLPLTHPELFTHGILKNSLTGVLLFGPPGTGKTMLARAVAQESGAAFLAVNMSNIFDMWVGEGEKNVKVSSLL